MDNQPAGSAHCGLHGGHVAVQVIRSEVPMIKMGSKPAGFKGAPSAASLQAPATPERQVRHSNPASGLHST